MKANDLFDENKIMIRQLCLLVLKKKKIFVFMRLCY